MFSFGQKRNRVARTDYAPASDLPRASVNDIVAIESLLPSPAGGSGGGILSSPAKTQVLIVDDDLSVRDSITMLLTGAGYGVSTAEHGFDALVQLKRMHPDLIISDLNMPEMSGFEFLSVLRRRFPEIPVIAMSGAYESADSMPGGIIADAFYGKGRHHPSELLHSVSELIRTSTARAVTRQQQSAPVWIPRNHKDSKGLPFIVLTCTQCLRSFPLNILLEDIQEIQETPCLFCASPVRYVIDFSRAVSSPKAQSA